MKKCTYCGKEYPDDAVKCIIDENPLSGGEPESSVEQKTIPPPLPITESAPSRRILTERQMRFLEVVLICAIAFGPSLYLSIYSLFDNDFENTPRTSYAWATQLLREGCYLGLLWYVLARRGQSFFDLGLRRWSWKNLGWSIILFLVGSAAFHMIYAVIRFSGLGSLINHEPYVSVSYLLFGGGIFLSTLLFQLLNPFFEELIVRAYLMTEIKYFTNGSVWAIIISTVLQSSYHLYQGIPAALSHVGTFLIFSIFYAKTGRITPIILAHLYTDVGATLHYWMHH